MPTLLEGVRRVPLALLLLWCTAPSTFAAAESLKRLYKNGQTAELKGNYESAYRDYGLALAARPSSIQYELAMDRVRPLAAAGQVRQGELLRRESRFKEALVSFFRALEIDPGNALAEQEIEKAKEELDKRDQASTPEDDAGAEDLDRPGPPVHLDALPREPITLNMTEDSRVLYETLGKLAGFSVLIDPDFVSKRVTLNLRSVTPAEALHALGDLSNTFYKPATHNTIYVAPDTRAKRTQLEQLALKIFFLSNTAQQNDINEVITTLRNVLPPATKLFAVPGQSAIVVRGTPDDILLAKQLILALDRAKPEVLIDVYVLEVSKNKLRDIGISPPTSFSVTENTTTSSSGSSSTTPTLNQVGRSSSYSFTVGQATASLLLTDSETRVLQNPSIRAIDGQEASVNIGTKIPIATGSFSAPTTGTALGVQTQFQYVDTGVTIKVTPTIHKDHDVTMKMHVEISAKGNTDVISGVAEPELSQEKAEQVVRVKDGEVSILAGLVQNELSHTVSGWPGLGGIPGVKYMFSTQQTQRTSDEIVFMVVPHIVRQFDDSSGAGHEIETGSSESIRLDRIPGTAKPGKANNFPEP